MFPSARQAIACILLIWPTIIFAQSQTAPEKSGSGTISGKVTHKGRGVYRIYGLPAGTYVAMADGINDYSQTGVNAFNDNVATYAPSSTRDTAAEITVRTGEEVNNVAFGEGAITG